MNRDGHRISSTLAQPATQPTNVADGSSARETNAVSSNDWNLAMLAIQAVASARNQNSAIEELSAALIAGFPGCSIRCGLGSEKLNRFHDLRLGWLGSERELFREAAEHWNDNTAQSKEIKSDERSVHSIRINIDQPDGLGRCSIWIESDGVVGGNLVNTSSIDDDAAWLKKIVPTLQPLIWTRHIGLAGRVDQTASAFGVTAKVYGTLAVFLLLLFLWPVSYRVRCTAIVQPAESRVIAAPFAANLLSVGAKPGDAVRKGDWLVSLDGRPLRLELESLDAQIQQARKDHDIALAGGKIADAQQAKLKQREFGRQKTLLLERLSNLNVVSPIDGVVIGGDLERSIGQPLDTGQSLIEIAPMDVMTIEIEIPEHDVNYVQPDTETRVSLTALSGQQIRAKVTEIYPAATIRENRNVFIAKFQAPNEDGELRPGMRGEAIAYGPTRPLLWSYCRTGWERLLWWIGY